MKAVESQFQAGRDSHTVKNLEQIISNNFFDGSDGVLTSASTVVAAAYILASGALNGALAHAVAFGVFGACAAFLFYNFPPATIFLGDSGSTVLGFAIAFLGLRSADSHPTALSRVLFAVLVAALPLLDASLAVIRRIYGGASPFHGDRRHLYDLMLARRWSSRRVALACCGITVLMCGVAELAMRHRSIDSLWLPAVSVGALLLLSIRLGALHGNMTHSRGPDSAGTAPRGNKTAGLA